MDKDVAKVCMNAFARYVCSSCSGRFSMCTRLARIVRLIRAVLGRDAIAERKLETNNPLVVLGIVIHLHQEGLHITLQSWLCASSVLADRC